MFCDKCGNEETEDGKFCDKCGQLFGEEPKDQADQPESHTDTLPKSEDIKKIFNYRPLIAVGFILIAVIGMVAFFSFYKSYQTQLESSSREFSNLQKQLDQSQASTTESLSKLAEENERLITESTKLKSTIRSTAASPPKEQLSSNSEMLSQDLLAKIMPRIVQVKCSTGNGVSYGSGTIQGSIGGSTQWEVYTNLHVVGNNSTCVVGLPQGVDFVPTKTYSTTLSRFGSYYPDIDFAVLKVNGATESFDQFPMPSCGVADIKIGHRVTVFGYPSFGGDSLTVTDGIVSGIEYTAYGAVYKTSAKIDRGNSGGLAIDNNSKCGIGIPTWATSGAFDGLGYIQSWDMITKSGNF